MSGEHDNMEAHKPVDESRRRLTKAGLVAPAVLGVLASRPVLGNSLHHCTPSGNISGFASPNPDAASCNVGNPVSHYADSLNNWPAEFLNNNNKPRQFKNSPKGVGLVLFADAYQRKKSTGEVTPATVWDVLKGQPVNANGQPINNMVLEAKSTNVDLELGKQAVAACMNAIQVAAFPIPPQQVVKMFNGVFQNGKDNVTDTNFWDKAHLTDYFKTLQT